MWFLDGPKLVLDILLYGKKKSASRNAKENTINQMTLQFYNGWDDKL